MYSVASSLKVLLRDVLLSRENYTFALDSQKGSTSTIMCIPLSASTKTYLYTLICTR